MRRKSSWVLSPFSASSLSSSGSNPTRLRNSGWRIAENKGKTPSQSSPWSRSRNSSFSTGSCPSLTHSVRRCLSYSTRNLTMKVGRTAVSTTSINLSSNSKAKLLQNLITSQRNAKTYPWTMETWSRMKIVHKNHIEWSSHTSRYLNSRKQRKPHASDTSRLMSWATLKRRPTSLLAFYPPRWICQTKLIASKSFKNRNFPI